MLDEAMTGADGLLEQATFEIKRVIVGQDRLVERMLVAFLASGHCLIEGVPGVAKTLAAQTLATVVGGSFARIQFTPDLVPSDIVGTRIYRASREEFDIEYGPVMTNVLLADEINRAPAKVQSALLEVMSERQVSIAGHSKPVPLPFLVLATQNPIESEGTYNLPEAQLDRFMFKLVADYPAIEDEAQILKMHSLQIDLDKRLLEDVQTISSPEEILRTTQLCGQLRVDDKLIHYVNTLVRLTRQWPQFHLGASPRAGIALLQGARTLAAFYGRDYVVPDDVVQIALPALRHRVILTAEAEVEGRQVDELLTEMIRTVEVPRL
jgi:MoxR-like ATPase